MPNPLDPLDGSPDSTLDLHGFGATEAAAAFEQFLSREARREPGALLHVITGKGRNSPNGPVLQRVIRRIILGDHTRRIVAWGRDDDEGGFLVRLSRGRAR